MGGKQFILPCKLSRNGFFITTQTLIDSGANVFGVVKSQMAFRLARTFNVPFVKLPFPFKPIGYDGKTGTIIERALILILTIDKRRIVFPFLVTDLGNHDLILGRKFLEHFHLLADAKNRALVWPESTPPSLLFARELCLEGFFHQRPILLKHQQDMERRDRLMAQDIKQREGARHALQLNPLRKHCHPPQASTQGTPKGTSEINIFPTNRPSVSKPYPLDIAAISATAITTVHLRKKPQPGTDIYICSMREIDHELERRLDTVEQELAESYEDNDRLIKNKLPLQYRDYAQLFSKADSDTLPLRKPYDHNIILTKPELPPLEPLRRQSTDELRETKKYILANLHKGFIEPSAAPYAAPILFVKKANGSLRFCVDYRKLNELTRKDPYPLPLIDEIMGRISQAKIFTKLDIQQAFHRIRMAKESEDLTTFRTRYGMYKYKVMPFGLTNGPATYQRFMNDILLEYLDDFCSVYLDDILIFSNNPLEHELHVGKVLAVLAAHGLQVDIKKSEFHVTRTKYLGFIISTDGIEVDSEKVEVIKEWEYAVNLRGVQAFLGFCNFYRRFIRDYSRIARPLIRLTGKDVPFEFDDQCRQAWATLRECLVKAPVLTHYHPENETILETDAFDGILAAVLSQKQPNGEIHPVGFFSKSMASAEHNYPIHDKEMLAIVRSFQQFRVELASAENRVKVFTDHKALEYFMTTKELTGRQARWAEFLAEFCFMIMYRPGKLNTVADTLSRRQQDVDPQTARRRALRKQALLTDPQIDPKIRSEVIAAFNHSISDTGLQDHQLEYQVPLLPITPDSPNSSTAITTTEEEEEIIERADMDPRSRVEMDIEDHDVIDKVLSANRTANELIPLRERAQSADLEYDLRDGLLYYQGRLEVPLTPADLRARLIRHIHAQPCTAHPGIGKTKILVSRKYHWKTLSDDIKNYVNSCKCVRSKVRRDKTPGFLVPLTVPAKPYQHLTMDFKQFPKDKAGYDSILVIMDRLSKTSVTIPCYRTCDARQLATLYLEHWVRHHGFPDSVVSDRGPQFVSTLWKELQRIIGVKVSLSTAFHPETDGQTEIMNQYIDQRLRPFVNYYQDNWSELVPLLDVAQLTLPHSSIGMSPYELVNGYTPRMSWNWENPEPAESAREVLNWQEAVKIARRMEGAIEVARKTMQSAQDTMARYANRKRRPVDWDVNDLVWVSTKNWKTDRPSHKLSDKWDGPRKVLEKVGDSWRLELPNHIKVHPVFHSSLLRKYEAKPIPGQRAEEATKVNVLPEQDEWEVQEILGSKTVNGNLRYRVKWLGAEDDPEYYDASDCMYAPHKVKEFHLSYPAAKGPPRKLPEWLKAYEEGKDDYSELEDNKPMNQSSRARFFKGGGSVTTSV